LTVGIIPNAHAKTLATFSKLENSNKLITSVLFKFPLYVLSIKTYKIKTANAAKPNKPVKCNFKNNFIFVMNSDKNSTKMVIVAR